MEDDVMESAMVIEQFHGVEHAKEYCVKNYGESSLVNTTKALYNSSLVYCPPYFDGIMCWSPTLANTTMVQRCPQYIIGFLASQNASRRCMEDGNWFKMDEVTHWTNYSKCIISDEALVPIDLNSSTLNIIKYIPAIKIIARTGYSVSFITLLIAFIIMFSIKKLHCARNKLHMHLFASFIFRAFIFLLKDIIFVEGVGLHSDIKFQNDDTYFYENRYSGNWGCKLITSIFQFFITANYSWILMEGLYLHNLIFRALFAESNRSITHYIVLGWGMPALVTSIWIMTRLLFEDTLCWTKHDDTKMTFLIIRIPTAISILLNMVLFIRIAVVIYSKLQAPLYEEAKRYHKWARSTLVLAPLFGIHYALLIGMSSWMDKNETIELIWLFADQLFASFQGFFVAILYCFMNSEVRTELKPHVHVFLTYVATNNYLKYCFPCRHRYLRSARGRTSVCTTMSCSSLFNNGVNHRNSRTKWEFNKNKNGNVHDRSRDIVSRSSVISWQESTPPRWNPASRPSGGSRSSKQFTFSSNGSIPNERIQEETVLQETTSLGENICMLPRGTA